MSRIDRILSENLRKERNKFADFRHGGVSMSSEEVEDFVQHLHCYIAAAEAMETALASLCPVDPNEIRQMVQPHGATILQMMRPGTTNVVPFPGKPHA
ncbi:DNA-directed RNA polymerase subunit F [Rhizobium skierniewicense]|uniref:DNA-directed RNA polymerase subunit F n=1 Tax=Rhizobium skierniewicense TaxID=984260 RepID=A0A7W6C7N1_9HYPH|nr:hypothetical protein [Rhizobium skierniewicense]MBB3947247.1 DNA-directed RNA polymerase subunit F [Rhizobium skierniewicense]